jgi:hypothetical protein
MDLKYGVGDKVVLRDDLVVREMYGNIHFLDSMGKAVGKPLTVKKIVSDECGKYYRFEECSYGFSYSEEMVKGLFEEKQEMESVKMSKYQVGDKVVVRSDLENKDYGGLYAMPSMVELAGETVTITNYDSVANDYRISEDSGDWFWNNEMFEGLADVKPTTIASTQEPISKYRVGDKVVVADLDHSGSYNGWGVASTMLDYIGKTVTIKHVSLNSGYSTYHLEEVGFTWTDEMFEGLAPQKLTQVTPPFKIGDKVTVRVDLSEDEVYGGVDVTEEMVQLAGQIVTITDLLGGNDYEIKEDGYEFMWSTSMFEEGVSRVQTTINDYLDEEIEEIDDEDYEEDYEDYDWDDEPTQPSYSEIEEVTQSMTKTTSTPSETINYWGKGAGYGIYISRVIYNNPVTVMFYRDEIGGREYKVVAKAQHGDVYNKEKGFEVALLKAVVRSAKRKLKKY